MINKTKNSFSEKILMYSPDPKGMPIYSKYLINALKKEKINAEFSPVLNYKDFNIIHIQFEHSVFHPFGLRLIPSLIKLKLRKKKIIITSHTVLSRKEIYSMNRILRFVKKILLPLDEKLMGFFYDKIIVHTDHSKKILIDNYKIPDKKIEVIPHGVY